MYISICDKKIRDSLPCYDFSFICRNGVARAHIFVMLLQSKTIVDMMKNGSFSEVKVDFNVEDMEFALDCIYGCASFIGREKKEFDSLSLNTYKIFRFLQVDDVLLKYKYYIKNIKELDSSILSTKGYSIEMVCKKTRLAHRC